MINVDMMKTSEMSERTGICCYILFLVLLGISRALAEDSDDSNGNSVVEEVKKLQSQMKDVSTKLNKFAKKEEQLEAKVNKLANTMSKFADSSKKKEEQLEAKMNKLAETVTKLKKNEEDLIHSMSQYCSLLPKDICGPCQCKDDNRLTTQYYCDCRTLPPKRDCLQFRKEGRKINGLYKIHQNNLKIIQVYCDQTTQGGGWAVFQRRLDGSVNFYRDWVTYRRGFGDLQHEMWLGNTNIFTLSLQGLYPGGNELRVELEDWEGNKRYATYNRFQVGDEATGFQIWVSGYSGNAGDGGQGMTNTNSYKFSTFDKDQDIWDGNCAVSFLGGWWYNNCHTVNLNGKYYYYGKMGGFATGIHWMPFHAHDYSLKFVEMKIRRKQ